jgi:hypothetical protein
MKGRLPMHLSPRCGAHCRTTGQPCQNGAIKRSGRCRMHGGQSTGPKPKHGRYTRLSRLDPCLFPSPPAGNAADAHSPLITPTGRNLL